MITRFASFSSRLAATFIALFAITACGGGGGGGGGGFLGDAGSSSDTYYIQAVLKDSDGNETSTVSTNSPGTLQVLITRNGPNGNPIADVIVTASTSSGLLFPSSGSKLTNAEGAVTFRIEAGEGRGAGTINVSVDDQNGTTVTETINFQLGVNGLRIGYLLNGEFFEGEIGIAPNEPISPKGTAVLALAIVDENDLPIGSAESIRLTSSCLTSGESTIAPASPIAVASGQVQIDYTAGSCSGVDQLTAELVGEGAQAFGTIEIADPTADSLTFISADPTLIVLKGTGGGPDRKEQSQVTFAAVDSLGNPQEGVEIRFSLTTDVGGITFNPTSATTDAEGNVSTFVNSGDVATVVRVVASLEASDGSTEVSAVSDVLTISTGLPDQNSISLSVEGTSLIVKDAMSTDGITRSITVRMADKFNNPVPDGTAAVFTTEYGSIESNCQTTGGSCSVTWTSQAPRFPTLPENQALVKTIYDPDYACPSHNAAAGPCPDSLGYIRGARSTILVTAIGEESFIDSNANGVYDEGERFANLTEAYLDNNWNGFYDPARTYCLNNPNLDECRAGSEEIFTDFNNNGVFDANGDDPANGYPDEGVTAVYNGLLCPPEGDGVYCSRELVNVRDDLQIILSDNPNWALLLINNSGNAVGGTAYNGGEYQVYVSDTYNNSPIAGTTISTESSVCEVTLSGNTQVPDAILPGAFGVALTQAGSVTYSSCNGEERPSGTSEFQIKVDDEYSESFTCTVEIIDDASNCPDPEEGGDDGLGLGG
ncbi:hypothetical protein EY643_03940 [Halioglobus maricola]|uniref:Big-1 domain-containing protein n=1 Tax=Halioglobus maricola TaxID=2601894 RepID=A0A5P9NH59_9GAMM|nr:hypothetical protein [Halioglobus maricola]QFU74856.1 hypothetical protein EY643_03940 [Halioglobus maricola]